MTIPDWWEALLLAGAAFRVWRILAVDDILDRPRRWLVRLGDWEPEDIRTPASYRRGLGDFIQCPACLGFWSALAWWAAWQAWEHGTLVAATPFALSAAVIVIRGQLDPPED